MEAAVVILNVGSSTMRIRDVVVQGVLYDDVYDDVQLN